MYCVPTLPPLSGLPGSSQFTTVENGAKHSSQEWKTWQRKLVLSSPFLKCRLILHFQNVVPWFSLVACMCGIAPLNEEIVCPKEEQKTVSVSLMLLQNSLVTLNPQSVVVNCKQKKNYPANQANQLCPSFVHNSQVSSSPLLGHSNTRNTVTSSFHPST